MSTQFSIIIPTYNRPMILTKTLLSLTHLSYPKGKYEVIIVDDGGSAPIGDVVAAFSKGLNIQLLRQRNGGPGIARNSGAKRARGEYLAFINDDCRPEADWLQILDQYISLNAGAAFGGSVLNGCPENNPAAASQLLNSYLYAYFNQDRQAARFFTPSNLAVPTRLFRSSGGFDSHYYLSGEDRDFLWRWTKNGNALIYVPEARVWHHHPMSLANFYRLHFSYGQGSFRFHRRRTNSQKENNLQANQPIPEPLSFYVNILRFPFSQVKGIRALLPAGLLLLSQIATSLGAIDEKIKNRKEKPGQVLKPISTNIETISSIFSEPIGDGPVVSVVIPTYQRPYVVDRAVRSVLEQTYTKIELIVVVDGRDEATQKVLSLIDDPRLRLLVPEKHLGNAGARNLGVREAKADWVAFLDDDDIWMPDKLQIQLRAANQSAYPYPIISCRVTARTNKNELIWPRRYPRFNEPLSEYLFCRSSPFMGEGLLQTSTIFAPRSLFLQLPFESNLPRHVDLDWVLRANELPDSCLYFVPENRPLVIWDINQERERVTTKGDWMKSLQWLRTRQNIVTPRAYAAFTLTQISAIAARQGAYNAFLPLLQEAFEKGKPSAIDLITHIGYFGLPPQTRDLLAARFDKTSRK